MFSGILYKEQHCFTKTYITDVTPVVVARGTTGATSPRAKCRLPALGTPGCYTRDICI